MCALRTLEIAACSLFITTKTTLHSSGCCNTATHTVRTAGAAGLMHALQSLRRCCPFWLENGFYADPSYMDSAFGYDYDDEYIDWGSEGGYCAGWLRLLHRSSLLVSARPRQ